MPWKDIIIANLSRKAQLLFIAVAGLAFIVNVESVDAQVRLWAIIGITSLGALTEIGQTVVDIIRPKYLNDKTDAPLVREQN